MEDIAKRNSEQDYKFCCILYPDAENYNFPVEQILGNNLQYYFNRWFYILHDKDVNADGTPKKPHYHLIVTKSTPSTIGVVSRQIGIPSNYVERCKSLKNMVCYLTHDEVADKFTYDKSEIITNSPQDINKFFHVDTDNQMGQEILDYIVTNNVTSIRELTIWATGSGYYSALRRGFAVFSSVVKEQSIWSKKG